MTTRLTDAQVAALATAHDDEGDNGRGCSIHTGLGTAYVHGESQVYADAVQALALEVQQSRQRRCGNCAEWRPHTVYSVAARGPLTYARCWRMHHSNGADWHCADFTPATLPNTLS